MDKQPEEMTPPPPVPLIFYEHPDLRPPPNRVAVLALGMSLCVIPAAIASGVLFEPFLGVAVLVLGNVASLMYGLEEWKELRQAKGPTRGLLQVQIAVFISVLGLALAAVGVGLLLLAAIALRE